MSGLYPRGPRGGIDVRYQQAPAEDMSVPVLDEREHVETPGQAMRWLRRHVRALAVALDEPTHGPLHTWLADEVELRRALNSLSRSGTYLLGWRIKPVELLLCAEPTHSARSIDPA
ncbi:hypothetical protein ACFUIY_19415 [Streptomyces griseorubiginosus]|uniref:hypothetical protein n=1 Tax=Streptomyces griseorubiginosus TaxID=67304 RepID=UPI00362FCE70